MTRLFDVPTGKMAEFHRVLAGQGMTAEMIDMIVRNPILLDGMIADLEEKLARRRDNYSEVFENIYTVCEVFERRLTERGWPIYPDEVRAFFDSYPHQASTLDEVVIPFAWLGSFERTYQELLAWLDDVYPDNEIQDSLRRPHRVQFAYWAKKQLPSEPTLMWIGLTGLRKRKLTLGEPQIGQPMSNLAALSLPVLHPCWLEAATQGDSDVSPSVVLPVLRYSMWGRRRWNPQQVLVLGSRDLSPSLFHDSGDADTHWSSGRVDGRLL
jgi:hypothetical protein